MYDIHHFEPLWDDWYIDELLGEGSFGKVYKAHKSFGNHTYVSAIKHLSIPATEAELHNLLEEGYATDQQTAHEFYTQAASELMKEIDVMYQLRGHTNIVSYEDHKIIPKDDKPGYDIFIRMELLTNLSSMMQQGKTDAENAVRMGIDICQALEIMEKRELIHRDIKPQNIFVNADGEFKLGDFGTARQMERTSGVMSKKGTYVYMAPEIYKGEAANRTVDLYSLGLVMYRMTNGNRAPFLPAQGNISFQDNEEALIRRMSGEQLPAPAYADAAFAEIILKACAFNPAQRYVGASAMRKALEDYADGKQLKTESPEQTAEEKTDIYKPDWIFYQPPESEHSSQDKEKSTQPSKPMSTYDPFEKTEGIFHQLDEKTVAGGEKTTTSETFRQQLQAEEKRKREEQKQLEERRWEEEHKKEDERRKLEEPKKGKTISSKSQPASASHTPLIDLPIRLNGITIQESTHGVGRFDKAYLGNLIIKRDRILFFEIKGGTLGAAAVGIFTLGTALRSYYKNARTQGEPTISIPMYGIAEVQKHFVPGIYDFTLVLKMGRRFRVDCSVGSVSKADVVHAIEAIENLNQ